MSVSHAVLFAALLGVSASNAFGQATTQPATRTADDRPAPAIDRVKPDLGQWWQQAVFYQVIVRSFSDSTSGPLANDGIGDIRGLIEKLDYLNDGDPKTTTDLGITALWLMPISESPSYHGYDPTDLRTVAKAYGTNQDFKDLVTECHRRGIRVIVDLVLNQVSSSHPWFQLALRDVQPYADWFVWREKDPGFKGPWGQQVWYRALANGKYYYGLFESFMPDPNYRSQTLTNEIYDITRSWLTDMNADGFRLDAIRHLIEDGEKQEGTRATHEWLERFYTHVKSVKKDALTVGEIWADSNEISRYVGGQMDLAFEFGLAYAIIDAVRDAKPERLAEQIALMDRLYPHGMFATFIRNHDLPRTMHELGGSIPKAKLAAAIQFALPGVPFVYYGEELGISATKPDPCLRAPMHWDDGKHSGFSEATPWQPLGADAATANVAAQTGKPDSLLSWYRDLIRFRQREPELVESKLVVLKNSNPKVFAFTRGSILAIFNLSDEPIADLGLDQATSMDVNQRADLFRQADLNSAIEPFGVRFIRLRAP
jgi:alpha-amylase